MITTKKELIEFVSADFKRQDMKHPLIARFTYGEHHCTRNYLAVLRHVEYYMCQKGIINKLLYAWYFLQYRRLSLKHHLFILPNTCGKGLLLPHPGYIRVDSMVKMGENCTILPQVLFGKKSSELEDTTITVGDNCYFGTGCTVLGPVSIGNNVTVGAGAVIINDVPDNAVVGGVPGKIIKQNCNALNINGINGGG